MDIRLSPLISWPEHEDLWHTMPLWKKANVIKDCFEVFLEKTSNSFKKEHKPNYKRLMSAINYISHDCFIPLVII